MTKKFYINTNGKVFKKSAYYESEEAFKKNKPQLVEITAPSINNFRKMISIIYNEDWLPIRKEFTYSGLKYFHKKTITYQYYDNVSVEHILIESFNKAFYKTKYSTLE